MSCTSKGEGMIIALDKCM